MNSAHSALPDHLSFEQRVLTQMVCPNCLKEGLTTFYRVSEVPIHSCQLLSTREEALAFPKGNIELAFCRTCGFVTNICFDVGFNDYSNHYESTQTFSGNFSRFLKSYTQRLIEKYDICDKNVIEIGCGNGEFLSLLCQIGDNRGIGIDPAFRPERGPKIPGVDITFIQDLYSEQYSHLRADVICCRHTLEHIQPTHDFLTMIRRTIKSTNKPLIFFDLPDAFRVFREGAFWDIYYEHCTYFTSCSLAKLIQETGFDIVDLTFDYGDQFLVICANPNNHGRLSSFPETRHDLAKVVDAIDRFGEACSERIENWQNLIQDHTQQGKRVVLWGSGSKAVAFLTTLGLGSEIEYVVDINPHRQNYFMPGTSQQIVAPSFLAQYRPDTVIVMNPIYLEEIKQDLLSMNVPAELLAV